MISPRKEIYSPPAERGGRSPTDPVENMGVNLQKPFKLICPAICVVIATTVANTVAMNIDNSFTMYPLTGDKT